MGARKAGKIPEIDDKFMENSLKRRKTVFLFVAFFENLLEKAKR